LEIAEQINSGIRGQALENRPSPLVALRARGPMGRRPKRGNSSLRKREGRRDFTDRSLYYFENINKTKLG